MKSRERGVEAGQRRVPNMRQNMRRGRGMRVGVGEEAAEGKAKGESAEER